MPCWYSFSCLTACVVRAPSCAQAHLEENNVHCSSSSVRSRGACARARAGAGAGAYRGWAEGAGLEHGRYRDQHVRVIGGGGGLVLGVQRQGGNSRDKVQRAIPTATIRSSRRMAHEDGLEIAPFRKGARSRRLGKGRDCAVQGRREITPFRDGAYPWKEAAAPRQFLSKQESLQWCPWVLLVPKNGTGQQQPQWIIFNGTAFARATCELLNIDNVSGEHPATRTDNVSGIQRLKGIQRLELPGKIRHPSFSTILSSCLVPPTPHTSYLPHPTTQAEPRVDLIQTPTCAPVTSYHEQGALRSRACGATNPGQEYGYRTSYEWRFKWVLNECKISTSNTR